MIHCFKRNGFNIVLDVNSGSVHNVDDVAYDMIEMYENHTPEQIVEAMLEKYADREDVTREELLETIEDIETLKEQGKLFSEDIFADVAWDFKKRQSVVKALCLHVAHDCNLACKYCFAEEGEYHGDRSIMSLEVGKKALDFLIANSGSRHNLEVDFFGGEPLMNWEVVKQLVAYGREQEKIHNKNFRFTLTTNGVLLDEEVMDFCNKEMGNVVLSLDGRKEVNDCMRCSRNGKGSYDLIVPKFQKMVEKRGDLEYYMRGTYTHYNTDFVNDLLHMADLG
ncbi:MAG: thioether cross-link-forming SCIFF peptide maturase, partial [Firmicutes bacterium]|nr:thioether cross-link-forming SCIFF peptide maturase [Bacillota bacterium]